MLAEVDYFLRDERHAMQVFMQDLARGAFTYAPPTVGQLSRAREVDRRYADLRLGLVDGSVVALAESLGIRRLATRDVRHFAAVRLRDGGALMPVSRAEASECHPDAAPFGSPAGTHQLE